VSQIIENLGVAILLFHFVFGDHLITVFQPGVEGPFLLPKVNLLKQNATVSFLLIAEVFELTESIENLSHLPHFKSLLVESCSLFRSFIEPHLVHGFSVSVPSLSLKSFAQVFLHPLSTSFFFS
jgi:hypothetical protein